jgi:hypothetical protein
MIARQNLMAAYDSWEEATQHEGAAIQAGNWHRVRECQETKRQLQSRIIQLTEAANAECAQAGLNPRMFEPDLRRAVNSLIALETRNATLLAEQRRAAELEYAGLDHAGRNLRRLQKSYAPAPNAMWQSYS